jgi:hypothetical protein
MNPTFALEIRRQWHQTVCYCTNGVPQTIENLDRQTIWGSPLGHGREEYGTDLDDPPRNLVTCTAGIIIIDRQTGGLSVVFRRMALRYTLQCLQFPQLVGATDPADGLVSPANDSVPAMEDHVLESGYTK